MAAPRPLGLGLLLLLAGCASSQPEPAKSPAGPTPAPLTQERITSLVAEVAHLRGLPQRAPVPVYLLDEPSFQAALRERAERKASASDIEAQKAFHLAFDLRPDGARGGARPSTTREVLAEQVLGFYDHERHHIVVRASRPTTDAEAEKERGILAHEIEHALQDQHFGRPDEATRDAMSDDSLLAYSALLEGDAMLTMFAYLAAERGVPIQRMVRRAADILRDTPAERFAGDGDAALFRALPIVRERLLFRYHAGTAMVAELYRAGGLDLVNRLFVAPPVSTEQVLHPEKYVAGEVPADIRPPDPPAGMRAIGNGTLGELVIRVVLGRCTGMAEIAAEGWSGDRFTLAVGTDGKVGLAWATAWDSEKDAAEFAAALTERPGCFRALAIEGTAIDGALVVRQKGKNVAVARGLPANATEEAVARLLELPQPPKNRPAALPYQLPPRGPLPPREPGLLAGHDYYSRYLGVVGRVPFGVSAVVGYEGFELRLARPDALTSGGLILSDLVTTPKFQEKLFSHIAAGIAGGAEGKTLVPVGGRALGTALGAGVERSWTFTGTRISVRAVMVPICGGTGSLVFLQSFDEPTSGALLDGWMNSFRWNTNVRPPVCEAFDPR
jgi:hypothetical protein